MQTGQPASFPLSGTTSSVYLKNIYDACVDLGCPETALLDLIPGGMHILNNPARRFEASVLFQLLHRAENLTGRIGIGVLVGEYVRPSTLGTLGHAMVAANTLEGMVKLYRTYQPLLLQTGRADVDKAENWGRISWTSDFGSPNYLRPYVERFLSGVATFGRWVTWNQELAIKGAYFRHDAPGDLTTYNKVFNCPLHFNAPQNYIEVPTALLEHKMPQPNPGLVQSIRKDLDIQLAELDKPITIERETFQIIKSALPDGH